MVPKLVNLNNVKLACISAHRSTSLLLDSLASLTSLSAVDVSYNSLKSLGAVNSLRMLLQKCTQLHTLNLKSCSLQSSAITDFRDALKSSNSLTNLNISCNNLFGHSTSASSTEHFAVFCDGIQQLALQSLDISSTNFTNVSPRLITTFFMKPIQKLSIGSNVVGAETLRQISQVLPSSPLVSLDLFATGITEDICTALCDSLAANSTLTHLSLRGNKIGDVLKDVITLLEKTSALKELDLSECGIMFNGVQRVLNALSDDSPLQRLHLCSNDIGEEKRHFPLNLNLTKCLLMLDLSGNLFTKEEIEQMRKSWDAHHILPAHTLEPPYIQFTGDKTLHDQAW